MFPDAAASKARCSIATSSSSINWVSEAALSPDSLSPSTPRAGIASHVAVAVADAKQVMLRFFVSNDLDEQQNGK